MDFLSTGKPLAMKVARVVWTGGKSANSYLSVSYASELLLEEDQTYEKWSEELTDDWMSEPETNKNATRKGGEQDRKRTRKVCRKVV